MSEFEFDLLLQDVSEAVGFDPGETGMNFDLAPHAANDNQRAWPMIPFPAGWGAAC